MTTFTAKHENCNHAMHSFPHNEKIQMAVLTDPNNFNNLENMNLNIEMDGKL